MTSVLLDYVDHELLHDLLGTACYDKAIFAIDATPADVQTGAAVDYSINGIMYTLAAQAAIDVSTLTGLPTTALATGYTQIFLFQVDSAGTITVQHGDQVLTTDITAGTAEVNVPEPDADTCVFAILKVANASGSDFTLGTTSLATAGVTDTYYDVCRIPRAANL